MQCPQLEILAEYDAGTIIGRRREQIAAHVAECPHCQRELAMLAQVEHTLALAPAPMPSRDLWPGVAAHLETARPMPRIRWAWRFATGVGLAAALLAGLLTARQSNSPPPMAASSSWGYAAQHELLSSADPLADRASLGVLLTSAEASQ